jgi:hypothetical protein
MLDEIDENTYHLNTVKYKAQECFDSSCRGCAFDTNSLNCDDAPICCFTEREDKRDIIWVKAR